MSSRWYPGIERFCQHWKDAPMLEQTFDAMKRTFEEENDGCIDAAKCMVECACQIIIENLDDPKNPIRDWKSGPIKGSNPKLKDWVSGTLKLLELTESRDDIFSKVLSQHYKLVDELGNFRNQAGPLSHGREGFARRLSAHHRRAAVLAADALITFLHEAYLEREPNLSVTLEPYERFSNSNDIINSLATISATPTDDGTLIMKLSLPGGDVLPLVVEPARLLFSIDREAYKYALDACRTAIKEFQKVGPEEVF